MQGEWTDDLLFDLLADRWTPPWPPRDFAAGRPGLQRFQDGRSNG